MSATNDLAGRFGGMARYFFHLEECGNTVADEEGRDFRDLSTVREHALKEAREIMSTEVKAGRLCLGCEIRVTDESGQVAVSIPFREALSITGL